MMTNKMLKHIAENPNYLWSADKIKSIAEELLQLRKDLKMYLDMRKVSLTLILDLRKELAEFQAHKEMMTDLENELLKSDKQNQQLFDDGDKLAKILEYESSFIPKSPKWRFIREALDQHKALKNKIKNHIKQ